MANVDLSLPTASDSTIYQPTRRSHRTHTLLPRRLTNMVEVHVHLPTIRDSLDLGRNILGMMFDHAVRPKSPSLFELLVISCGGYDLLTQGLRDLDCGTSLFTYSGPNQDRLPSDE